MKNNILLAAFITILFNHGYGQINKVSLDDTQTSRYESKFVNDTF